MRPPEGREKHKGGRGREGNTEKKTARNDVKMSGKEEERVAQLACCRRKGIADHRLDRQIDF